MMGLQQIKGVSMATETISTQATDERKSLPTTPQTQKKLPRLNTKEIKQPINKQANKCWRG